MNSIQYWLLGMAVVGIVAIWALVYAQKTKLLGFISLAITVGMGIVSMWNQPVNERMFWVGLIGLIAGIVMAGAVVWVRAKWR